MPERDSYIVQYSSANHIWRLRLYLYFPLVIRLRLSASIAREHVVQTSYSVEFWQRLHLLFRGLILLLEYFLYPFSWYTSVIYRIFLIADPRLYICLTYLLRDRQNDSSFLWSLEYEEDCECYRNSCDKLKIRGVLTLLGSYLFFEEKPRMRGI